MQANALLLKLRELSDLQFLRPFDTGYSADEHYIYIYINTFVASLIGDFEDVIVFVSYWHDDAPWPIADMFSVFVSIEPLASTSIPDCCDIQDIQVV